MGGFDAYAFQIRVDMDQVPLERSTLDRLQLAMARSVPAWSGRARLSRLGPWPVGESFAVSVPGSLDETIQAHRPGGARAPATVGLAGWSSTEMQARLTGADRGASITFSWIGSERSGEPAGITQLLVETTQRVIDGIPAGEWSERLFRALCVELAPAGATACSLGERGSSMRHDVSGRVVWLTYIGPKAATGVRRDDLGRIEHIEVEEVAGGILIRLDPTPALRRTAAYWQRARAVEATFGSPRVPKGERAKRLPPSPDAAVSMTPTPLVPKPIVTKTEHGAPHFAGARYERMRFAQLGLREPGAVVEGFELVRCELDNVGVGSRPDGAAPVFVRNCSLTRCRSSVVSFGLVAVEDCLIDGAVGGFWATATVLLKHVVMRGPIDALDLRSPLQLWPPDRPNLPQIHADYYRSVDWALDIRDARFKRCDIGGVPGHLVRRDPATQILITRSHALAGPWREATAGHFWTVGIERLLESGGESEVFVACPRGDRFDEELAMIARLREAGITSPD